jgi:hypothetical protein
MEMLYEKKKKLYIVNLIKLTQMWEHYLIPIFETQFSGS